MKGFKNTDRNNNIYKKNFKNNFDENYKKALKYEKSGDLNKASEIYDQLIKYSKEEKVFLNYANLCQQLKNNNKAVLLYKESIKINPNNFVPFFKMGFILNNNGRYFEAYPFAKRTIEIEPKLWQGHHNLIKILRNLNRPHEAIEITKNATKKFPKNHLFFGLIADIYSEIGDFKSAKLNYEKAIKIEPQNDETIYGYVNFTMGLGEKENSIDLLNKIIKINKYHSMSYYSLSRLINPKEDISTTDKILNLKIDHFKDNYNKYNILFSKSHIFHRLKNYEKSAENLLQANELKLRDKPSNLNKVLTLSNNIMDITSKDNSFDSYKFNYLRDVFIVGLPRSGSTLIESIIGINSDVYNLGETSIFMNVFVEKENNKFAQFDDLYNKYTKNYSNKKYTTNKTLSNYMYVPYIISKMNYSKIIYTFRNPLDNILSMYKAKFTGLGNEYSSSIIDSAIYYLNHFKIMQFYKEKYKERIYFLNYDELVNDPEEEIQRLINWLGWSWDNNYLYPYKNKQAFFTASNVQVRSPINNNSVGGWKKYENMLKEAENYFKDNNFSL